MKLIRQLLVAAMTFALVIAFTAVPAMADTTYTPIGGSTTFVKNLVVDSDANIPDIEFTYTITRADPVAATSSTLEILQSPVGATIGTASFSNASPGTVKNGLPTDENPSNPTDGKKYAQRSVTVSFPSGSFTKPGVYRYIINEGNGGKPGVTYDTSARYLDVFVVANGNNVLNVNSYVLRSTESAILNSGTGSYEKSPGEKSAGYTNTITQFDFTFSKAIAGNQGDKNKRFTFALGITNAIPGTYPVTTNNVTGTHTSIEVGTDGTYTGNFDLTDGSSLTVLGLNQNAVCKVTEDAQDYSPSHVVDTGSAVSNNDSGNITMNDNHTVAFTNTREGVIPTGIIMTVAPFAVGLVLFGFVAVWFARRKKNV